MRKRVVGPEHTRGPGKAEQAWLNLDELAQVEVTSEEPGYPIESALLPGAQSGWRAGLSGQQVIRLIFDQPQPITRILLSFVEAQVERTQEFTLRWSADGRSFQEIVRQQWNFSPNSSTQEREDYRVSLAGVSLLELTVIPDKNGGEARASIDTLRLA